MRFTAISNDMDMRYVRNLSNTPTQEPDELKLVFDQAGIDLKNYINDTLISELEQNVPLVVDDLATGGTAAALSAEQGKNLNTVLAGKQKAFLAIGPDQPPGGVDGDIWLRYS